MTDKTCRWGILSTAAIARKNWHSIVQSENAVLTAVASRSVAKAADFIASCSASVPPGNPVEAVGSYDELLGRDDIDAVYIPLPTALRKEWVVRAADAGKHVLVEKPCAVSADELQEMLEACERNGVQFMDGVMFMHSKRLPAVRSVLDDASSVGQIRRIASQFSFFADDEWVSENIRVSSSLEPAGCLGDLGWYTIRMTLWTMHYEMPTEVRGRILHGVCREDSPEEVPVEFQGEMHFANGVSATFYNSFRGNQQQWVNISGEKGFVQLDDFVLPFFDCELGFTASQHGFIQDGCRFNLERHTQTYRLPEYSNNAPDAQETNLFRNFSELVLSGKPDPVWGEISLKTQRVLDAALRSARNNSAPEQP